MRVSPTPPAWRPESAPPRQQAENPKGTEPADDDGKAERGVTADQLKADLAALRRPAASVASRYLKQAGSGETMSLTTLVSRLKQLESTDKTGADELLRHLHDTSPDLYDLVVGQL